MESSLEKQLVELYLAGADIIGEGLPAPLNRPRAGALETFNLLGIPPRGSVLWRCRKPKANGFRC